MQEERKVMSEKDWGEKADAVFKRLKGLWGCGTWPEWLAIISPPWRCPEGHSLSKCGIRGQVGEAWAKQQSPRHPRHKVNHLNHTIEKWRALWGESWFGEELEPQRILLGRNHTLRIIVVDSRIMAQRARGQRKVAQGGWDLSVVLISSYRNCRGVREDWGKDT